MEKVREYDVIYVTNERHSNAVAELTRRVNAKIKEGWQPLNGVVVAAEGKIVNLYQTIIK